MRITFLTRQHMWPGTALHNAADMDARFLHALGHSTACVTPQDAEHFKVLANVLIVEGGGWVPVEVLKAQEKAGVKVIVRIHAAPEWLHYEHPGQCATEYIRECKRAGIHVGFVSHDLAISFGGSWMPINYPLDPRAELTAELTSNRLVNIGCYGAIRPAKNHIAQLLGVARARDLHFKDKHFSFAINSARTETGGRDVLPELRALGQELGISVIGQQWHGDAEDFKQVLAGMHLGMCASMAESFCLTAADFVNAGKPVVMSSHIPWATEHADTVGEIASRVTACLLFPKMVHRRDWLDLKNYLGHAQTAWETLVKKEFYVTAN